VRRSIADVYLFVVLRRADAVEINPFSLAKNCAPLQADAKAPETLAV
jgi:hypothetical protein